MTANIVLEILRIVGCIGPAIR